MITAKDLVRFCDETMTVAGGDVRRQLDAWGVDHDEFFMFCTMWSGHVAEMNPPVSPMLIKMVLFVGFELGYRSCAEGGMADTSAPDFVPNDILDGDGDG